MALTYKEFAAENIPLIDQAMISFLKKHSQSEAQMQHTFVPPK